MTARDTTPGLRYSPQTEEAKMFRSMLMNYQEAYEKAHAHQMRLLAWALDLVDVQVGDIVFQNQNHGKTTGFVGNFEMSGIFPGWRSNPPRMRVEAVFADENLPLIHSPSLKIRLKGVPLKEDGTPFKAARCSVTVDVYKQAMQADCNSPSGYQGYEMDMLMRYADGLASAGGIAPKVTEARPEPIGSDAWLKGFSPEQQGFLQSFAEARLPVKILSNGEGDAATHTLVFAGTKVPIAVFADKSQAEAHAKAWHDACAA